MIYQVSITPAALDQLGSIQDRRVREKIRDRIDGLGQEPDKQGKPLWGEMSGYRSLRAVGQRYRVVYRIARNTIQVIVLAIGIRKQGSRQDIYELARRLIRLGLIG